MTASICPYCNNPAKLVNGSAVYPRYPALADKLFWQCKPCDAYVGVHAGSERPLGRLANAELRKEKMAAHAAFDPLWKRKMARDGIPKKAARAKAYKWLAEALSIPREECHIGMMDIARCKRVVEICNQYRRS